MSGSSKGRSIMWKAGILEEVVTPMIKHLEIAEKHIMDPKNPKSTDGETRRMFKEINVMVENQKVILEEGKKWEGVVIGKFCIIERHIDNILEDSASDTNMELKDIHSELQEIMEKITPSKEHHEEKSKSSNYEKSGPSKTSMTKQQDKMDDSFVPFIDEIIDTLDPQLRLCLFCLTIFPEKSVIKRRLLIYWWIALKLVCPERNNTTEQIGGLLFNDLVDKGILIPLKIREHNDIVDKCTVEPNFHKKLISSAGRKRFIIDEKNGSSLQVCTIRKNKLEVDTILNVGQEWLKSDVITSNPVVKKMAKIAVMQVGQWRCVEDCHHIEADKTDFLNELMPNLTYLSLQNISRIPELPEPIGNSTSLMILDVRACHNLEKLPPKIKALKNLTHLDVSMCYLLDHIPRWISTLRNLEVFKGFVIGSSGNKNRCRLSDISGLRKLWKLSISIGHEIKGDEELNSLKNLSKLRSLTITWGIEETEDKLGNGQGGQKEKSNEPGNIFPENLEKLDLRCFPNAVAPKWLSPTERLKRLYIRGGKLAELPSSNASNNVWKVETLRLRFLENLKKTKRKDLKNLFQSMKFFEWEERDKSKSITVNEQQMAEYLSAEDKYLS